MICQTCKNDGVLSSANGKEFWYCRTCKVEIMLEKVQSTPRERKGRNLSQKEIDLMLEAAASGLIGLDEYENIMTDNWDEYINQMGGD